MSVSPKDVVSYLEALKEGATLEECAMLDVARAAVLEMVPNEAPRPMRKDRTLVKAQVPFHRLQEEIPWPSDDDR